jgi:hypothetical protein
MGDIIFKTNGEETFRISHPFFPYVGTKCPETKLEVKEMTEYQPTPQTPEQVADGLRNAFRQAMKDGVMDATPYLKQMTFTNDIQKTEAEIKVLQKKLELLKEIETHKSQPRMNLQYTVKGEVVSYNDEVYYRLDFAGMNHNWYKKKTDNGVILVKITDGETHRLLEGVWFNDVKKGKYDEPYCPDDPPEYDEVEWDEKDNPKPMDEVVDKMLKEWEENPPEFLKFEMGKTLEALITRWWCDVFTTTEDWDMETAIDDLIDQIQLWLPKEQSHEGTQDVSVIDLVDGFNDAITKIKSKLRNKK